MIAPPEAKCSICGATAVGAFVQYGSYFTRCAACGEAGPATSWMAISGQMNIRVRAIVVDSGLNEIEVLGKGRVNEISDLISQAAKQGKLVRLMMPDGSDKNIGHEKAKQLAKRYLEQNPLQHPDYVWTLPEGRECKTGWYFDFTFKCLKNIPENEWEGVAAAFGFVVNQSNGQIRCISASEYADNDF